MVEIGQPHNRAEAAGCLLRAHDLGELRQAPHIPSRHETHGGIHRGIEIVGLKLTEVRLDAPPLGGAQRFFACGRESVEAEEGGQARDEDSRGHYRSP
jgi:hypothetical protein